MTIAIRAMKGRTVTRPLIGMTMDTTDNGKAYHLSFEYPKSIELAGGMPFPIPYKTDQKLIPSILDMLDGVLFTGGNDLDPALYGEDWHPNAIHIDPERQRFEMALMAEVEGRRVPTLGICLGSQLMNVYRGGSLVQFIPDLPGKLEHRRVDGVLRRHPVKLEAGSQVARAIGKTEVDANTYHKQAVKRVGRGLRVIATAPDGIIEGLDDPTFPLFAAVQWHPERLNDEADHLALFKLLVEKSREAK
jgi:putative glutamine amidotransferase